MNEDDFLRERSDVLEALTALVVVDPRIDGLWLQGSLARGDADPLSDIDAYISVSDDRLNDLFGERASIVEKVRKVIAWSDATTPGLKAVHAVLEGGVRLDLFFEAASAVSSQQRPVVQILVDKSELGSRLQLGWQAPVGLIGHILGIIIRMTRQGGTWPLRTLRRGQWSTFAMMELDLINAQIAQLMAVQNDPANFYQNAYSLSRHLTGTQRDVLDGLTGEALAGLATRDAGALLKVHLKVLDGLIAEGRAACESLGVPYPITAKGDQNLRALLVAGWPK